MRWIAFLLLGVLSVGLAACGSQDDGGKAKTPGGDPYPAAQMVVDDIASAHPNLTRLTLHAVPGDREQLTQVASTMAERRGKPSDPEDLEAMKTGEVVILDEEGAIDVTVPILVKDDEPTAIAGVTLKMEEGADREALIEEARTIAKELEAAVHAAESPLW